MSNKIKYEVLFFGHRRECSTWDEVEKKVREIFSTELQLERAFDSEDLKIRRVEDVTEDSRIHFLPIDRKDNLIGLA